MSTAPARRPASWSGAGFVLPFALVYGVFLVWPTLAGLWSSFFDQSLTGRPAAFVGTANWSEMLSDPAVWSSLWNTVVFTALSTPPLVLTGLALALLTQRVRRLGWLLRFSFFAPYLLPVAVVTLIWVWLYQPGFGLFNAGLARIGLPEVGWLSDERVAMLAVVVTTTWWTAGFNYLLYLAALQGIPRPVYEAAELDGAGAWQRLTRITLPMLRRVTGLVVVLQLVASLKIFDQVYLMTRGGPNLATRPLIQYVYETGFGVFRTGYASAVAYMFLALLILVSLVQFRLTATKEDRP
ncbi:carbohydrate ABC transporter permease [Marinactinospora rubrisoli]|uniref:Carbohydrate ABC transporter permease n=1 Tax=Marinactinospora rubrisoli TaxID=2715399 RepID=A0ABW2KIG5_9ACTN